MHPAETHFERDDLFTGDTEAEMARLYDARVDGADGYLIDTLAFDRVESVRLSFCGTRDACIPREIFAQRVGTLRPVLFVENERTRIRMSLGLQSEHRHDLAFVQRACGIHRGERRKCRAR